MKPLRLLILLLFLTTPTLAQDPYFNFVKTFVSNYNNQTFGAIHDYTNDAFKAQVTKEQIVQILTAAYASAGKITETKMADSTANRRVYNLICERGAYALTVALDPSNKVGGLLIRPLNLPTTAQGVIDQWKANNANAGMVVGRIINGKPEVQYYGVANKEMATPVDGGTIFEIGSISKTVTGILLHTLIAEKKVSLDDPANKFLPEGSRLPKVKDKEILIRHLVTHTSCLPRMPSNFYPKDSADPYADYSENNLLALLPRITTGDCELGTSLTYSNLGAGIVGYILTKVSGKKYSDLLNERIAKPLKTKSFGIDGPSDKWSQGYLTSGTPQSQWQFTDALVGAGGVDASADDMVKVLSFFMKPDQSPLGKAVVASTSLQFSKGKDPFGTFWVRQTVGSNTVIWHNGMTGGYNAFIGWVEGTQNGAFVLLNNGGTDTATNLGMMILGQAK
jgi:D-alanyl-D-alanine-carboxypeptidase/D-alanyl-D-alanine-endopeptidase